MNGAMNWTMKKPGAMKRRQEKSGNALKLKAFLKSDLLKKLEAGKCKSGN
jgi:hypothetical protein